jgi:hypothetical protein
MFGNGLTAVIGWFGDVISALTATDGALVPLFTFISVAVGVSLLGLGLAWVRKMIWGW